MDQILMDDRPVLPRLQAAGRVLDASPQRLGRLRSTSPSEDMEALRRQLRQQGYLWLKDFLDPAIVNEFRGYVFAHLMDTGIVKPGGDPRLGLASGEAEARDRVDKRIMELVRAAAYEAFCAQQRLWRFMDEFLGGISYLHRRKLLRHTLPNTPAVTPAHYDLVYLRGGTDRIVTVWIPIGDIPAEMGGLVYLEGSHAEGVKLEAEFRAKSLDLAPEERIDAYNKHMAEGGWISKDLPGMAERFNSRWLAADYEAGDIVLHSPYMIHASTMNEDRLGRIRLSTDIRYQNVSDEIDARWANHWSLDDML
jgi:ectoine hydroxylase-related dioxygenase (phytanoyl-CoA dioxygenase family)